MRNWLGIPAFTIYDRGSGAQVNPSGLFQDTSLNGIDFSPDGAYVAYEGGGVVFLLDASSGEEISALPLYWTPLTSLRFSPDGDTLAVGTDYGSILLWDLALLDPSTDLSPYRTLACSLVGDFPQSELEQYFTTQPDQPVCPEFPR
jgi:WD40 repeat protein